MTKGLMFGPPRSGCAVQPSLVQAAQLRKAIRAHIPNEEAAGAAVPPSCAGLSVLAALVLVLVLVDLLHITKPISHRRGGCTAQATELLGAESHSG
ncbi:hypothetical protein K458DRAFT_396389 [Lentithecium fluviatile CBS 122367]|uniref:Uncharacterized protein n=1 Tax=Lentithecium fluviatile CBS 122367 TaxID=1168545 RepID=A0A6G1IFP4_9PLEO|nr:hypothetical protein K458DRAFT_396389 [Lentithecium fluviatile CBS 122367]